MRKLPTILLGLVEWFLAAGLVALGLSLPERAEVRRSFDGARRVTGAAGEQVRRLWGEVDGLRRSRLPESAERLERASRTLAAAVRDQPIDFEAVRAVRDAAGRAADGLDHLATALDPSALGRLGEGLGSTADFLDHDVLPAADSAADDLEAASGRLKAGAESFAEVFRAAPSDLGPVRELHDGLARFDDGLASIHATLDPRRLAPMRQAADGAEGVVGEAARLAERAAGYSYPVVELDGIRPKVEQRPFWPSGGQVGADLRRVAGGVGAMDRELERLAVELPKMQAAVADSRRTIAATRSALGVALERREEVERLLAEMPAQSARLAEELPGLTAGLASALRDAGRLAAVRRPCARPAAGSTRRCRTGRRSDPAWMARPSCSGPPATSLTGRSGTAISTRPPPGNSPGFPTTSPRRCRPSPSGSRPGWSRRTGPWPRWAAGLTRSTPRCRPTRRPWNAGWFSADCSPGWPPRSPASTGP